MAPPTSLGSTKNVLASPVLWVWLLHRHMGHQSHCNVAASPTTLLILLLAWLRGSSQGSWGHVRHISTVGMSHLGFPWQSTCPVSVTHRASYWPRLGTRAEWSVRGPLAWPSFLLL